MTPHPSKAEPALCPNGDGRLGQVTARSRHGQPIVLDQCERCGGIWFDRFELFQIDESEASALDDIDEGRLRYPAGANEDPLCPRCRRPLRVFSDPNIPANIQMLICDSCEGLWLNHGAIRDYAGFRSQAHPAPDPRLAEEYEKMLAATSSSGYWNGIAGLAQQFGGRRDMITGLPLEGDPRQLEAIDTAHDAAFGFVRTIARLLFGI